MRNLLLISTLVFVLCGCESPSQTQPNATDDLAEQITLGRKMQDEGHYEQALVHFNHAVEINSNDVDAVYGRALVLADLAGRHQNKRRYDEALGKYREALDYFDRAIKIDSGLAKIYSARAQLQSFMGDLRAAKFDIDEAYRLSPNDSNVAYARAVCYMASEDYDTAYKSLLKAVELEPKNDKYLCALSGCCAFQGQYHQALQYINKALEICPNDPLYLRNRAEIWRVIGEEDKSQADFEQARRLESDTDAPHIRLGPTKEL